MYASKEVAQATCSKIVTYRISEFSVDIDQLLTYGSMHVTVLFQCTAILMTNLDFFQGTPTIQYLPFLLKGPQTINTAYKDWSPENYQ